MKKLCFFMFPPPLCSVLRILIFYMATAILFYILSISQAESFVKNKREDMFTEDGQRASGGLNLFEKRFKNPKALDGDFI